MIKIKLTQMYLQQKQKLFCVELINSNNISATQNRTLLETMHY